MVDKWEKVKNVIDKFGAFCDLAEVAFWRQSEKPYELALIDILNFVKRHPECREQFVEGFKSILSSNDSPFEVVAFCMRELQWKEFKDFSTSIMTASADPRDQALRSLLTAYDDVWPDADLYEYYSGDE
ncbi:hypothetical protein HX882_07765 [Pseudomonas gingeri]|uniref:Uncharacterized protein n=1 Tax=Pseudomonas gingeri TaxID=117681 RepID=A0A7Y8C1Q2_9PSED|nr:hypothetical protein [Pseudomonas gingeri]NWB95779.1 hypothetical protein [Pseudomonas gingeri]